jgi:hypothetical protein
MWVVSHMIALFFPLKKKFWMAYHYDTDEYWWLPLRHRWVLVVTITTPMSIDGVRVAHFLCVFTFLVLCYDVRYDFRIKTMFGLSLPPVVCRRNNAYVTCVCILWCPTHLVLCFCFVCLRLVYSMLPVSLDCPFLIGSSVFSNVYVAVDHISKH